MTHTTIKVRLIPDSKQERLLRCHAGTHRYAYNLLRTIVKSIIKRTARVLALTK